MKRVHLFTVAAILSIASMVAGPAAAQSAGAAASTRGQAERRATAANPDRWEEAIRKFEAEDAIHPPPQNAIVFVGSSSIVRWHLDESFPDLKTVNRGFGGSEMKDSLRYVDRIVIPYKPRIVVIYAGDNDIERGTAPKAIADQFMQMAAKIHAALPNTKVIAISIKPSLRREKFQAGMNEANAIVEAFCQKNAWATYLDVVTPMLDARGKPKPELFVDDGLHMTPAGYAIWDAAIRPLLQ